MEFSKSVQPLDKLSFIRALPKAELHLHLEGSVGIETLVELAAKHSLELPLHDKPEDLLRFADLGEFLQVYDLVCRSMQDVDDFIQVTYEMLQRCADHGARYVEFFFSPHAHTGIDYPLMLQAIRDGMQAAHADFDITSRVIPAHSRELGAPAGMAFLEQVLANRCDEVIGIGLDYQERPYPPDPFQEMYRLARKAGLQTTAHAGEDGPAAYVRSALDTLGCPRIDHGYHIVDDPRLIADCRARGIWFTCCPTTTLYTTQWRDLSSAAHPIRQMLAAGLNVTLNTDDPGLFRTNLSQEYAVLDLPPEQLARLALNSLEAAWLDEALKKHWRDEWQQEISRLFSRLAA
ncbi:adenosine deaminase [Phytohalomonas tamaricis]|uniref:adenosine deaminase n=1 Tax=Phytohalomonas tamaricis TaxID=2081032 RepID=UPI000D0BC1CC|nr:adenosine deaminase [Phytohalomonas tamaricis]